MSLTHSCLRVCLELAGDNNNNNNNNDNNNNNNNSNDNNYEIPTYIFLGCNRNQIRYISKPNKNKYLSLNILFSHLAFKKPRVIFYA